MARYIGSVCRICRREGDALFLKGARCFSEKCAIKKRNQPPGQHGKGRFNKKHTSYEIQLREKQKVRKIYGILERQFRRYYFAASRKTGNTGTTLLQLIESRLDNVIYRIGFTFSRTQARMWVTQTHFLVNGKPVNIPSFTVRPGDIISVKESSPVKKQISDILESTGSRDSNPWLEVDSENLKGKYLAVPDRSQIDPKIQESLIIEFYSR